MVRYDNDYLKCGWFIMLSCFYIVVRFGSFRGQCGRNVNFLKN